MWGWSKKKAIYEPGTRFSPNTESAGTLILYFLASGPMKVKCFLLKLTSLGYALTEQPEQTEINALCFGTVCSTGETSWHNVRYFYHFNQIFHNFFFFFFATQDATLKLHSPWRKKSVSHWNNLKWHGWNMSRICGLCLEWVHMSLSYKKVFFVNLENLTYSESKLFSALFLALNVA